jgi:hypothetical protein
MNGAMTRARRFDFVSFQSRRSGLLAGCRIVEAGRALLSCQGIYFGHTRKVVADI